MTFIPNGSQLTWKGAWISGVGTNPQSSANQVSTELRNEGMHVVSLTYAGDTFLNLGQDPVTYEVEVQTDDGTGHASERDVQAIIEHAIYQAVGVLPISGNITKIALAGTGGTGPQVTTPPPPCQPGFLEMLRGWFGLCTAQAASQLSNADKGFSLSSITSGGLLYIGLAIFGFVAALALIGYSGALRNRAA